HRIASARISSAQKGHLRVLSGMSRSSCTVIRGAGSRGSIGDEGGWRPDMFRPVLRAIDARSASTRGRRRYIVRSLSAARRCRRLVGMEQPQSPPANRSEPGPRQNDRPARGHRPNRDPPAVEIDPRGAPIHTTTAYIDQRVAHLARRAEGARVIPIRPYPTTATEDTVQTLCDPDG